jgi:hypothetical protein
MLKLIYIFILLVFMKEVSKGQSNIDPSAVNTNYSHFDSNDFLDLDYLEKNGYTRAQGSKEGAMIYAKSSDTPFNEIIGFEHLKDEKKESFLSYFNDPQNKDAFQTMPNCDQLKGINAFYKIIEVGEEDQKMYEIEACYFIESEIIVFFTMNEKNKGALASLSEACHIIKLK